MGLFGSCTVRPSIDLHVVHMGRGVWHDRVVHVDDRIGDLLIETCTTKFVQLLSRIFILTRHTAHRIMHHHLRSKCHRWSLSQCTLWLLLAIVVHHLWDGNQYLVECSHRQRIAQDVTL